MTLATGSVISGGGTITLTGTGSSIIRGFPINSLDVHNEDNLIQGKGSLGGGTLELINELAGVIDANDSTGALTLIPRANESFANQGLMRASSGGELVLSGNFDNQGGTIEAANNSTVTLGAGLAGAAIEGGDLTTSGNGTFVVPTGSSIATVFQDLDIHGPVIQQDLSNLRLAGSVSNHSEISVQNSGSNTNFQIIGNVSLDGGWNNHTVWYL